MSAEKLHKWETRPLDCWAKAKELRRTFEKNVANTVDKKEEIFVYGGSMGYAEGFDKLRTAVPSPQGMMCEWATPKYALECRAKAEQMGHGREICGYHLNVYGEIYNNRHYLGGPTPRPHMISPAPASCDHHQYPYKTIANHFKCAYVQASCPRYVGPVDPAREKAMRELAIQERLDILEQVKRVMGREFNEENYVESVKHRMRVLALKEQAGMQQMNIPAPLSCKDMYSFMTLGGMQHTDMEPTLAFWRMLNDELEWRVKNKIAAVGYERYRWVEEHPPPWTFLKYYRYMEKYGAVCVGTVYSGLPKLKQQPDGTWQRKKTPLELGVPMNTVEDTIRAEVDSRAYGDYDDRMIGLGGTLDIAKAYNVNGAFLSLWRSAVGCAQARRENGLLLEKEGFKVLYWEGSQPGNCIDLDENRMLDQLDTFMETQGLHKIEEAGD
jgi:benzoyl-CoA reductase subunit B